MKISTAFNKLKTKFFKNKNSKLTHNQVFFIISKYIVLISAPTSGQPRKIKKEFKVEKSPPVILKPIIYSDSVPDILKYHSTPSKAIQHPKPPSKSDVNVSPVQTKSNSADFFGAFESFLNKPKSVFNKTTKTVNITSVVAPKNDTLSNSSGNANNVTANVQIMPKLARIPKIQPVASAPAQQPSTQSGYSSQASNGQHQTSQRNSMNNWSNNFHDPDQKLRVALAGASGISQKNRHSLTNTRIPTASILPMSSSSTVKKVPQPVQYQQASQNRQSDQRQSQQMVT